MELFILLCNKTEIAMSLDEKNLEQHTQSWQDPFEEKPAKDLDVQSISTASGGGSIGGDSSIHGVEGTKNK